MNSEPKDRQYLTLDPSKGYPSDKDLYYECLTCGGIIPSLPDDDMTCTCRNIMVDVGASRFKLYDPIKARLFRLIKPSLHR